MVEQLIGLRKEAFTTRAQFHVNVGRRFDNRREGLSDDSPLALELHRLRSKTLHEVLDRQSAWTVIDWGNTDDSEAHEFVELILEIVKRPEVQAAMSEGLQYIGGILLNAGIGAVASECAKLLLSKLRKKQKEEKITDVTIQLSDTIRIHSSPPEYDGKVYVTVEVDQTMLNKRSKTNRRKPASESAPKTRSKRGRSV